MKGSIPVPAAASGSAQRLKNAARILCALILLAVPLAPADKFPALAGPYLGQQPPGDKPVLFAPGIMTSEQGYHSSIVFSPDLREAIWCPMSRDGSRLLIARMADGKWSAPRDTDLGLTAGVLDPIYSTDGKKLFFLSFAPDIPGGTARERIWCAERTPGGFSRPTPIDEVVRAHPTHWTFSVARNGNLYFTSEIEGARGGQDIYVARFAGGKYLAPEELGPAVNGAGKDFAPFIAADESYLVFARLGPETRKADLYVSFRKPEGGWTQAQDMGPTVNSTGHDLAPYVSPDGRYLFFVSQRERLNGIYWLNAAIIHKLRPGKFSGGAN